MKSTTLGSGPAWRATNSYDVLVWPTVPNITNRTHGNHSTTFPKVLYSFCPRNILSKLHPKLLQKDASDFYTHGTCSTPFHSPIPR